MESCGVQLFAECIIYMGAYDESINDKSAQSQFVETVAASIKFEYLISVVCFLFTAILDIDIQT